MISADINLNSPFAVKTAGMQALKEALGPVGMVRFMQQFEDGEGDYTKEREEFQSQSFENMSFDELDTMLRKYL